MYKTIQLAIILTLLLASMTAALGAVPPARPEEGPNTRLRWKVDTIRVSLSTSLTRPNPNIRAGSDVTGAVSRSFAAWETAGAPNFELTWTERQSASPAGNSGDGISLVTIGQTPENLLLFSRDQGEISARTRVFFNGKGAITEADIVLNPYQQFSTDGSIGTFDLESTLTHEIGHLLGLEHSAVFGATMHEDHGKNGVFSLQSFSARTLSDDDAASLRSLYGVREDVDTCCGKITGRILSARAGRTIHIWAEDAAGGKVAAETPTDADGSFRMEGLPAGEYRLYGQGPKGLVEGLGRYTVEKGRVVTVARKFGDRPATAELKYLGFNGQLSELAVLLNRGRSYTVYLGGRNIDPGKFTVELNSPYLSVVPDSIASYDYDDEISVVSFEIRVKNDTPLGDYSISVRSASGEKHTIIGGLTIEEFSNPWSTAIISEN